MTTPRCPYCLDDLAADQEAVRCAECRTPHHHTCFQENGGCVAFGCQGQDEVQGGQSIFYKPAIKISHQPTAELEFGPFTLGFRALVSIPEKRPAQRCPDPYARLTFELREIREGDLSRGRGVVYVPERTSFKRVVLHLYQGIQRPHQLAKVVLADRKGVLEPGSHPFYLELRGPPAIPFMDPFQLELVLVRGLFKEVTSLPLPVYLLQRRFQRDPPQLPVIRVARRPSSEISVDARPQEPPVFVPPQVERDPFGPSPAGWHDVPVRSVGNLYDSGDSTGRRLRARFCPVSVAGDAALSVDAPSMPASPEFPVRIGGGGAVESLNLAIHYELVRPGGGEVEHPGFPAIEELRLFGSDGLESFGYGGGNGVEVIVSVPQERLTALADARSRAAHNAALRLHIAVDAIDRSGHVLPSASRSVTFAAS